MAALVRADALEANVRAIYESHINDPEGLDVGDECDYAEHCIYSRVATGELIAAALQALALPGAGVGEQRRTDSGFVTRNLWLDLPGRTQPTEWVIAVAHYDAFFGGADDNTTSVAVVLEAASALSGVELDRSVRLLFVDGEEYGMVGAGRYVEQYGTTGVSMALNTEMIGHRGKRRGWPAGAEEGVEYWLNADARSAEAAYQVAHLARQLPEPVRFEALVFPSDGISTLGVVVGVDRSDHVQFWFEHAPALYASPLDAPGWYHTPDDTPDVVDYDQLARMGRVWIASLAAFATLEQ